MNAVDHQVQVRTVRINTSQHWTITLTVAAKTTLISVVVCTLKLHGSIPALST